MKRFVCIILSAILLIMLSSCGDNADKYAEPVEFYYLSNPTPNSSEKITFIPEIREAAHYAGDTSDLMDAYFAGPKSNEFLSPFPDGVKVLGIERTESHLLVTLNPAFASLSGLNLTAACACISMTLIAYTGCEIVEIRVPDYLLDGAESICMTKETLVLSDDMIPTI